MPLAQPPTTAAQNLNGPIIRNVTAEGYRRREEELARAWFRMLDQSGFLTIKYGMINAEGALKAVSHLPENWDSYGAEPPSDAAVAASKSILTALCKSLILPSTIVPSATGGVSIYFFRGDRSAYIENYNDGTQALVMYEPSGSTEVLELGFDLAAEDVASRLLGHLG